jgi:hypothetical protein
MGFDLSARDWCSPTQILLCVGNFVYQAPALRDIAGAFIQNTISKALR